MNLTFLARERFIWREKKVTHQHGHLPTPADTLITAQPLSEFQHCQSHILKSFPIIKMGNPFAELGLAPDDGKLSIDHAILVNISKSMEDTLRHTLHSITKSSRDASRVMKVVGYAAAAYLVMAGVARIIEASKKGDSSSGEGGEDTSKKQ